MADRTHASPDEIALDLIAEGRWRVDAERGEIWSGNTRAEYPLPTGYGVVPLRGNRLIGAHRLIWLAAVGPIPGKLQVNHRNRRPWDNRLVNLELTTPSGNARHWRGHMYDYISPDGEISGPDAGEEPRQWMVPGRDNRVGIY